MTSESRRLPIDSDLEGAGTTDTPSRPVHLHKRYLGVVALGGMVGTALRALAALLLPVAPGFPWATVAVNLAGALLLGFLLEALVRRGDDTGMRRTLRLLLGTGVLGGFTTYSTLATDTVALASTSQPGIALGYAAGTVLLGAAATWAGIVAASALHRTGTGR